MAITQNYSNYGGIGNRTTYMTFTTNASGASGTLAALIDGVTAANAWQAVVVVNTGKFFEWDFSQFLVARKVTKIKAYGSASVANGNWQAQYWDGTAWQNQGIAGGLTASVAGVERDISVAAEFASKFRMLGTGGGNLNSFFREFELEVSGDPLERGNRTGVITVTSDFAAAGAILSRLVDGNYSASGGEVSFNGSVVGKQITLDLLVPRRIVGLIVRLDAGVVSQGTYNIEASNDGVTWDLKYTGFVIDAAVDSATFPGNPTEYRYWRLLGTAGAVATATSRWLEIEPMVGGPVVAPPTGQRKRVVCILG